jgi:hypothetical protein
LALVSRRRERREKGDGEEGDVQKARALRSCSTFHDARTHHVKWVCNAPELVVDVDFCHVAQAVIGTEDLERLPIVSCE